MTLSLLTFLLLFQLSLPQIAVCYRDRGLNNYEAGRLASAEFNYQRSLALNPNDGKTHFYLGSLYEALNDIDAARSEYQIAMVSGSVGAFNNMARLHILDENYDSAAYLLRQVASLFEFQAVRDEILHYSLHKNLGWVRLRQGLRAEEEAERRIFLSEAKAKLQTALELAEEYQLPAENQAPAHCLLAQVIEARVDDSQQAIADWEYCLDHSLALTPEEYDWKVEAQRRLILTEIPNLGGDGS
ncbi:MAG: tetratricopeptide repeat protein [Synechococcus sp.]